MRYVTEEGGRRGCEVDVGVCLGGLVERGLGGVGYGEVAVVEVEDLCGELGIGGGDGEGV